MSYLCLNPMCLNNNKGLAKTYCTKSCYERGIKDSETIENKGDKLSKEYLDIMLDFETMSTRHDAAIISIGAVVMDFKKSLIRADTFYKLVDLKTSVAAGGHLDPDTIMWWVTQKEGVRKQFAEDIALPLNEALQLFSSWISFFTLDKEVRVWSCGATFDLVIAANAYKSVGIIKPWPYWGDMCYRTMKNLNPDVKAPKREGTHHNALDDAKYQALHLIEIMKKVNK